MSQAINNKRIRVLFFKDRGVFAWLIRLWTRARFAHVQLSFDGDQRLDVVAPRITWMRGGQTPDAVKAIDLPVGPYDTAWCLANGMVGGRYDWQGIAGQAMGIMTENPGRWFCSEAAAFILQTIGQMPHEHPPEWYSPERLALALHI